jgi:gamma-glutamylaminecyclotransferase
MSTIILRTLARKDDAPMTLVFVYGSLMRGFSNHAVLTKGRAQYLGKAETRAAYSLVDLGPFPGLVEPGGTRVRGEVYEVDPPTLAHLDRLEGHPKFYQRRQVALARRPRPLRLTDETGRTVWAYFLPSEEYGHRPMIMTGDWRRKEYGAKR